MLCLVYAKSWKASLCTTGGALSRYASKAARELCPELQGDTADLSCPAEDVENLPEVTFWLSCAHSWCRHHLMGPPFALSKSQK